MGEPCPLSAKERTELRVLARRIVQSVIDDVAMPLGLMPVKHPAIGELPVFYASAVESLVMQLAQEIVALTNEKQAFCRAFQVVDVPKESE